MNETRVLISGDYWHDEFRGILVRLPAPVTLMQVAQLDSIANQSFDLIVLAQARPDQIAVETVEKIQASHPTTPIVALLGSWCEGGMRSDVPWPGVRRIYWHQWSGRFDQFSRKLSDTGVSIWHQPGTATDADDSLANMTDPKERGNKEQFADQLIAISAADQTQYEYLRDALEPHRWKSCWIERATFGMDTVDHVSAICIDANSFTAELHRRIDWLDSICPHKPTTLLLNFPRAQDVEAAARRGIHEIVSKPFQPTDLKFAIEVSINRHLVAACEKQVVHSRHRMNPDMISALRHHDDLGASWAPESI